MKKENLIWIGGALVVGAALFFAYKKRSVPKPSPSEQKEGQSDMKKRKLPQSDVLFVGMDSRKKGEIYVKPTNLIPDVYGRYHNADGSNAIKTTNIGTACSSVVKNPVQPTVLANFR